MSLAGGRSSPAVSPALKIITFQPTWINVTASGAGASPPPAASGVSAYDPASNETVYFGGCLNYGCSVLSNQTWVFANGTWTNVTNPYDAPPARDQATMDYDANMHGVLLFGGVGAKVLYLDDTWLFQGNRWTNVSSYSAPPPARYGAAMTFDPQPEENGSVLFGGYGPTGYLNDTWVWQGDAGWVALKSTSLEPPAVVYTTMAYDAADGYVVQFGGYLSTGGDNGATWELYSGQWWTVSPTTSPPARSYASMVYDPGLDGVVLFGGYSYETGDQTNQTWLFSSGDWSEKSPTTAPPAVDSAAFALAGTGATPILFGGDNLTPAHNLGSTWAYEFGPGVIAFAPSVSASEVGENVTFSATVVSGTAPYSGQFVLGDGSYAYVSGAGPTFTVTHAYRTTGSFDASFSLTDAVGAKATSGTVVFPVTSGPVISARASTPTGDVGIPIAFDSSVVVPGTLPLTYLWQFGDGAKAATENSSHAYAKAGSYEVSVAATDADDATSTATMEVTIVATPTLTASLTPTHPTVRSTTAFYANASGGVGPYTYTWKFGDGSVSALPDPVHEYNSTGSYTVEVLANDSAGASTHETFTVTVQPSSSSGTGSLSNAPGWFWGGVGALGAVAVAGSVLLVRRGQLPRP